MKLELKSLILQLSREQKVIFAALTCEKMYPIYNIFSLSSKWGNARTYTEGIITLYNFVLNAPDKSYDEIIEDIELIMPDLDDFTGTAPSHALDACVALVEAVSFLVDYKDEHIINCSIAATDTVDMHVQIVRDLDQNDADLDNTINSDALMVNELQRQGRLISALKATNYFTQEKIAELRLLNGNEQIIDLFTLT